MIAPSQDRFRFREIFADRTLGLMLGLAFGTGLPFLLVFSTQSARLTEAHVPIESIGLISWVALCYSLKFVWSPIIDRVDVPLLASLLGRRRAWLLVSQLGVVSGLLGLAFADPARSLAWVVACSAFTAFAGATQDIVVDGWRIDAAPSHRQGVMAATYQLGYRLALLSAGAGAFYIAEFVSWRAAYSAMAVLMSVGIAAGLASPRLTEQARSTQDRRFTLQSSFVAPVTDLIRRYGAWLIAILLLIALYRLPDFLTGVMANPLYITLGFQKSDIATIGKLYGIWIGIAGAFAGGISIARLGLMPSLLVGGIAASASHLCLAWLAASGPKMELLTLSVSVESFAGSFAGTALIAYMSSLVSPSMAASQYALLSSLYALPGKIIGGLSGFAVKEIGFPAFFVASSTIGLPVALLCISVWTYERRHARSLDDRLGPA
jgi:PAT family beta-lactamase induction signal transducer AmpG